MNRFRRWQRIFILSLLSLSVLAPIVLVSNRLKTLSLEGRKEFVEDISNIKYRTDTFKLNAIEQESGEGIKEPNQEVYRDHNYSATSTGVKLKPDESGNDSFERSGTDEMGAENKHIQLKKVSSPDRRKEEQSYQKADQHNQGVRTANVKIPQHRDSRISRRKATDERVKQIKDQLIRAKAYLSFAAPAANAHLVKELKLRIKELERALGEAKRDSDLSKGALQRSKNMESTLLKASHVYPDCSAMVKKLRAMALNAEDQFRAQRIQANFLTQLAGRTTPKGLHCLSMRLTADYFVLQPEERVFANQQKLTNQDLFHYVVFSDNVLAAAVVVNSTVFNAKEPEKIVLHVVTDFLNFPAISMWFLLNPPGNATIQVLNVDSLSWLSAKYASMPERQNSLDPRYSSQLNHLRFYLPEIFPLLDKVVFLDHDVVVQRDLSDLWSIAMKGKVNGAVETCHEGEVSYRHMDTLINFSDPLVSERFDANACTWAFGMNIFDLKQWRLQGLSEKYHRLLRMGYERPLWTAGSLPLGWVTFYEQTQPLESKWHVLGLGYETGVTQEDVEQAAVVHYDGIMKPWLDIAIRKYKGYWTKYMNFDHPYLQQCNLHE